MTDNELLQLAAKAIDGSFDEYTDSITFDGGLTYEQWQPLNDDGDALRLAIKFRIAIYRSGRGVTAELQGDYFDELDVPDAYASTRRAIVRAVAEIGKNS